MNKRLAGRYINTGLHDPTGRVGRLDITAMKTNLTIEVKIDVAKVMTAIGWLIVIAAHLLSLI